MRVFNIFFTLIFILFAALQYNDPDPWLWIPIYGFGAVMCLLAALHKYYRGAYLFGIFMYLVYASYLFFTKDGVIDWATSHDAENIAQTMEATRPWIEDTREFFGLLILIIALLVNYIYAGRRRRATA
ncbi:transmembrane 220 family protein [Chitinophaga horti]|uniref:Transmembrane 220 family protein n=1 Tax=Chitinophaga horti TaxID=2920382 RepID=A0ABY6J191_9BACT|nr:transmembrane 220 family protein [Chitinophaga horti]UYQ92084.1 transmembrane 220 family protein [Chitinophaga horti]